MAGDLLATYQNVIDDLVLVTGANGVFDVVVDDTIIYSKTETGRHAEPGEVRGRDRLQAGQAARDPGGRGGAGWETVVKPTSNYLLQIMINAPKMGLKSLVRAYDSWARRVVILTRLL